MLAQITQPSGRYLRLEYNDYRQISRITDVADRSISYVYNTSTNLVAVTNVLGGVITYAYTNVVTATYTNAHLYSITLPNGVEYLKNLYDDSGRVVTQTLANAETLSFAYSTNATSGVVTQFTYEPTYNKLTAVIDPLGRTNSFSYDSRGNLTDILNGGNNQGLYWNSRNQLTNITGSTAGSFAYDGLGRRVTRTVSGSTVKYVYDGLDAVLEKDAGGVPLARYLRGLAIDEPWQRSAISFLYEGGPTNSLRGWWKMNEGTGSTVADSSGNGNTATLANGATWGSGVASNAVVLDGVNDYLSVGDKATLEGNATWTFGGWINPDQFFSSRDTWLFYKQNVLQWGFLSGASRQQSVNIGGGGNNSLQGAVTNSTQLSSNAWTHVAVTYTNRTVAFYVNGLPTDTISKTFTMGSNNK